MNEEEHKMSVPVPLMLIKNEANYSEDVSSSFLTPIKSEPDHILDDFIGNTEYSNTLSQEIKSEIYESMQHSSIKDTSEEMSVSIKQESEDFHLESTSSQEHVNGCQEIKSEIYESMQFSSIKDTSEEMSTEDHQNEEHPVSIKQESEDCHLESASSQEDVPINGRKIIEKIKLKSTRSQRLRSRGKETPSSLYIDNPEDKPASDIKTEASEEFGKLGKFFECHICVAIFGDRKSWNRHRKDHEKEKDICPKCKKEFATQGKLKKHMDTTHPGWKEEFRCKVCRKIFIKCGELREHRKAEKHFLTKQNQLFTCSLCKKMFKMKEALFAHFKKHEVAEGIECMDCKKKFESELVLKQHMAIHDEERNFECSECQKTFREKRHLKKHLKVHERESSSFVCPKCPKKFLNEDGLSHHLKAHTYGSTQSCHICQSTFSLIRNYEAHMKNHQVIGDIIKSGRGVTKAL